MSFQSYSAEVAAIVRAEVAYQGKTQAGLVKHLAMSQPAVSRRLRGSVPFSAAELAKVAEFLGKPVSALLPASSQVPA